MNIKNNYSSKELNIIDRREITQSITVDSLYRKNYKTSLSNDFVFEFPTQISNVISMRLSSMELPNTWYIFTEHNNKFTINMTYTSDDNSLNEKIFATPGTYEYNITLSPGNYTTTTLTSALNEYFITNSVYEYPDLSQNFLKYLIFEIDNYSNKSIFRFRNEEEAIEANIITDLTSLGGNKTYDSDVLTKISYDISFKVNVPICIDFPEYETAGWIIGYRKSEYQNITKSNSIVKWGKPYYGILESEGIFGANKMNYVFLSVNDFVGNSKDNVITGFGSRSHICKNLLGRIAIKYGSFYINMDMDDQIFRQRDYFGPVNIKKIHVKLIDKYGSLLDLNGSDFSFILEFIQTR
jgi:hypothetical protein